MTQQLKQPIKNPRFSERRAAEGANQLAAWPNLGYKYFGLPVPFLSLHTYLVRRTSVKMGVPYIVSPALHIAATNGIELASATSLAQFLLASTLTSYFSLLVSCLEQTFGEE